jgi:hypothetical protein
MNKNLETKMNELAEELYPYFWDHDGSERHNESDREIFSKGFQSCHDLMIEDMKKLVEALCSASNYLSWREDDLIGDDCIGDKKLTARYKNQVNELSKAIQEYESKWGEG